MRSYEGTYIMDVQGKEEGVDDVLAIIKEAIESLGGKMEGAQRMGQRPFESAGKKLDSGYYVGVRFQLEPEKLDDLREKFRLDKQVFRDFYLITKGGAPEKKGRSAGSTRGAPAAKKPAAEAKPAPEKSPAKAESVESETGA
jgi:ribosomal protein S6